jgi:O-methyltransferase involved in polyketide biosynthesis
MAEGQARAEPSRARARGGLCSPCPLRISRASSHADAVTADVARISVTAKVSAYYRKFSDIAFAAEVATLIGADEAFAEIAREHGLEPDKLTFYAPMFEARYKSITQIIRNVGASQVLELACGYSLRGLDLTRDGSLTYVETDLRDVIATKLELLDELRRRHALQSNPAHVVMAADALVLEELRRAATIFDRARPVMVLCEGLVGYLTREEIVRLADNVRELLGEVGGGWWVVPDFAFKTELQSLPPERIRLREAITGVTQRQLDASAFENADDLTAFLRGAGFDMRVCSQIDETPSFSTIAPLGLSPAVIDRLRPTLRVWVMTPVARS